MTRHIVFVGGGHMAVSLVSGLRQAGWDGQAITVIDHNADKCSDLAAKYAVHTAQRTTVEHLVGAEAVVLAVKPQSMAATLAEIAPLFGPQAPLILSVAAGVPLATLRHQLSADYAFVRCMPNIPSLLGVGASGLYADTTVTAEQRQLAEDIMATVGHTVWVDAEKLIDVVTATSGSGPAYFFALMEAMIAGAQELGLDRETARQLVLQTALGAARMANESADSPAQLRDSVASKGGTTAAAIDHFQQGEGDVLVAGAMRAAADRAAELAQDLSDSQPS
jgi:pyrroline-5-carboxylate reductase